MSTYFKGQRFDWYPTPAEGPVFEYALSIASDYLSSTDSNTSRGVSKSKRKDKIEAICIQIISALYGSLNALGVKQDDGNWIAIPRDRSAYNTKQNSTEKVFGSQSYTLSIVDWLLSQKSLPNFDWKYVCRHRYCASNDNGWRKLEKKIADFNLCADRIYNDLEAYKCENGCFSAAFYEALDRHGFET